MATWKTVTVNPSGGDYATLQAALAGEATDLTDPGRNGDLVISCQNFQDTTVVDTDTQGWTTSSTCRVIIQAAGSHDGKWSTSAYRLVVSSATHALRIRGTLNHSVIKGLQIYHTATTTGLPALYYNALGVGTHEVEKLIVLQDYGGAGTTANSVITMSDSDPTYKFRNCVVYGTSGANNDVVGLNITGSSAVTYFDNCTIDGVDTPLAGAGMSGCRMRNTRITNCANAPSATLHTSSDYNLTDASSASVTNWGANSIDSTDTPTIDYVDDSNATLTSRDYHLGATDSGIGAGTDLSSDGNNPFSDDIDGETRG